MSFINNDFLLHSDMARRLYHGYAASEPILDFHSHLPASEIAEDRHFHNLAELWLEGDHYKWRLMRANGIDERYCTGDAPPYEKFQAWTRTVRTTLRNPLYHWTHLELQRYFEIDDLLNERTAKSIWDRANAKIAAADFSVRAILRKFRVRIVCTSDDPCDDLSAHRKINAGQNDFRVFPTFRPDKALQVHRVAQFNAWVNRLERASNMEIRSFAAFLDALKQRHDLFHSCGARVSDHGLPYCYAEPCTGSEAEAIFTKARAGAAASLQKSERFASYLMLFFGQLDAARGWTKQLHIGALRDVRSRKLAELGSDTGFDCMGDFPQVEKFCRYLDLLDRENALPKIVVYNVNPADTYALASAIGSFQDGPIRGKIQIGSAWWFLDQKDGIESQLNALSNTGLLATFVGMVTDSRSFLSFPRHEYFRRILCNLFGRDAERGELPNDEQLLGEVVRNICYANAKDYLGLAPPPVV